MKKSKKSLALNIAVVLAIVLSVGFVIAVGGRYTVDTSVTIESEDLNTVDVRLENENVAEIENVYFKDSALMVDLKALEQGETKVIVYFRNNENAQIIPAMERKINVTFLSTIIETTNGNINFSGFQVVIAAIIGVLILTELLMVLGFLRMKNDGDFSYSMIGYGGVAIYVLILLLFTLYKTINNVVNTFGEFLGFAVKAGEMLLLVLMPIMIAVSVLLVFSNIWLMRHEGVRPVNALGIVFGLLWFVGIELTFMPVFDITELFEKLRIDPLLRSTVTYIVAYFESMFISTMTCSYLSTKYTPALDRDYIIILGCGIRRDGSLTPLLKGRVDSAVAFEKAQYEANGKHALFVPSGGQGEDEIISESKAMSRYLESIGVPEEQILCEDKSVNTFENMKLSKKVIELNGGDIRDKKIAFATTNYHVLRGYILAKKNGFDAKGISAKTKLYFYPNAFLREFIGLLVDKKWNHLLFVVLMLAAFFGILFLNSIV